MSGLKDKNHMIILTDTKKVIDKNQTPFAMKAMKRIGMEEHTST